MLIFDYWNYWNYWNYTWICVDIEVLLKSNYTKESLEKDWCYFFRFSWILFGLKIFTSQKVFPILIRTLNKNFQQSISRGSQISSKLYFWISCSAKENTDLALKHNFWFKKILFFFKYKILLTIIEPEILLISVSHKF